MRKLRARSNQKLKKMEKTDISGAPGIHGLGGRLKVLRTTRAYLKEKAIFFGRRNGTFDPLVSALWELMEKIVEIEIDVFLGITGEKDEIEVESNISKYFLRELTDTISEYSPRYRNYEEGDLSTEDAIELMEVAWAEACAAVEGLQDALQSVGDSVEFLRPTWLK